MACHAANRLIQRREDAGKSVYGIAEDSTVVYWNFCVDSRMIFPFGEFGVSKRLFCEYYHPDTL